MAGHPAGTFAAVEQDKPFDPYAFHNGPRIHFVEWVDRDLRSFSFGGRIQDPLTGEVLKGHVRIDSLRVREDILMAAAFLSPFSSFWEPDSNPSVDVFGDGCMCCYKGLKELLGEDILQVVLQRVKLLGAHEVGHALGLAHNFAGSSFEGGFASVMDYPPPLILLEQDSRGNRRLVLNNGSYTNEVGFFDKVSIDYGYRVYPDEATVSEAELKRRLYALIAEAEKEGYDFLTDQDSMLSGSDWRDTRWDRGRDPVEGLKQALEVRRFALDHLNERALLASSPVSRIRTLFPLVYLYHRYEVEACAKLLGGMTAHYAMKLDEYNHRVVPVPRELQLKALHQLVAALHETHLTVSSQLQALLSVPPAFGYELDEVGGEEDLLSSRMAVDGYFDVVRSYEVAAEVVLSAVFEPHRVERIASLNSTGVGVGLLELMETLTDAIFPSVESGVYSAALRAVQTVLVNRYLILTTPSTCSPSPSWLVVSQAKYHLEYVQSKLLIGMESDLAKGHIQHLKDVIDGGKPFMALPVIPNTSPI